jgi:hypothetical protein
MVDERDIRRVKILPPGETRTFVIPQRPRPGPPPEPVPMTPSQVPAETPPQPATER